MVNIFASFLNQMHRFYYYIKYTSTVKIIETNSLSISLLPLDLGPGLLNELGS